LVDIALAKAPVERHVLAHCTVDVVGGQLGSAQQTEHEELSMRIGHLHV
jgi:hypothetical protein